MVVNWVTNSGAGIHVQSRRRNGKYRWRKCQGGWRKREVKVRENGRRRVRKPATHGDGSVIGG